MEIVRRVRYLSEAEPQQMLGVDGFDTCVVRFTTDIPYLTNWGKPLLFGPGSILDAHTDHERIAKRELDGSCGSICEAGTHAGGIDFSLCRLSYTRHRSNGIEEDHRLKSVPRSIDFSLCRPELHRHPLNT